MYPGSRYLAQQGAITVPLPSFDGDAEDAELIAWVGDLLGAIFPAPVPAEVPPA
jgi:transcription-repair coupling factor (superfamily II helicase)